jgi:aspartyl/glutamyl-tRNA(Asn/Gln) amidotransferase C subunit
MTDVKHLAKLANLTPSSTLIPSLEAGVDTTLEYAKILGQVDVSHVAVTNEITGLTNVLREDVVDESRTFTQDQSLANAPQSHNGFFMVNAILE